MASSSKHSTRSNPNPPECFQKLKHLCNVCGQFQPTLRTPTHTLRKKYKQLYEREMFADGIRSPDKVCSTCRINVTGYPSRAFNQPMIWDKHKTINVVNHDESHCYCCKLPSKHGKSSNFQRQLSYPYNVSTITPPQPLPYQVSNLNLQENAMKVY